MNLMHYRPYFDAANQILIVSAWLTGHSASLTAIANSTKKIISDVFKTFLLHVSIVMINSPVKKHIRAYSEV